MQSKGIIQGGGCKKKVKKVKAPSLSKQDKRKEKKRRGGTVFPRL